MKTLIAFLIATIALNAAAAIELKTQPSLGQIEFEAIGKPSMLKIKGLGDGVASTLSIIDNKLTGSLSFNLNSLKTGIDLRDDHMKNKYLETAKFPEAKLTFAGLPFSAQMKTFKAKLLLHGVEKEVSGTCTVAGGDLKTVADFEIALSDFKIEIPSYMGVKVADKVKVSVLINKFHVIKK